MDLVNCIRTRRKGKHLNFEDRQELERIIKRNNKLSKKKKLSQGSISNMMGVSPATISRELKRGAVKQRTSELEDYTSYSAMIAQDAIDENAQSKGPNIKLGHDRKFHDYVEHMIIEEHFSPDAVIMEIERKQLKFDTKICTRTLYNYIENGYFENLTKEDLPRKGKTQKRSYHRVRRAYRSGNGLSISERPEEADNREEFGHWEMDCVEPGKGKGRACLLTMVERKTNFGINFKMSGQTQEQVQKQLNRLERKMGRPKFSKIFKSITVDNGSEFLDTQKIQQSLTSKTKARTMVYYCHPYSSWERGANEQMNGQIRRFIPKGSAISKVSTNKEEKITRWLNNYPKRSLDGQTSEDLFKGYIDEIAS